MVYNIFKLDNERVLESEQAFVDKPVNKICQKLETISSKKFILYGPRSGGKTLTALRYMHIKKDDNEFLTYHLKSADGFHSANKFDCFEHFIELKMAQLLLFKLRNLNRSLFENHFIEETNNLEVLLKNYSTYINKHIYDNSIKLNSIYKCGDLFEKLLSKAQTLYKFDKLNLFFDHFDSIDFQSQQNLMEYAPFFEKLLLTVDTERITTRGETRQQLITNGYAAFNINYGKNKHIVKNIINGRINHYNYQNNGISGVKRVEEIIDDNVLAEMVKRANGNISIIISTMTILYRESNLCNYKPLSMEANQYAIKVFNEQLNNYFDMFKPQIQKTFHL